MYTSVDDHSRKPQRLSSIRCYSDVLRRDSNNIYESDCRILIMVRLEWSRYSGDDIEAAVAMFLSAQFPQAERITPSQGDGGIDVLVKSEGRTRIYQVKKFSSPLTSSQRTQIKESVDRVVSDPRVTDLEIDEWHLVMPLDPTLEAKEWLSEYVTAKGLPEPIWDGLTRCDQWAATYPHIVDYYFRGGEKRVQEAAMALIRGLNLQGISDSDVESLDANQVATSLADVTNYLHQRDPFYDYEFTISPVRLHSAKVEEQSQLLNVPSGVVFSSVWGNSSFTVQVNVYAKNKVALDESPIRVDFTLEVERNSAEHDAVLDFLKFGTPFSLPEGSVKGNVTAPSGLGGEIENASVTLSPQARGMQEYSQVRLLLFDKQDQKMDSILLEREYVTAGIGDKQGPRGVESKLKDESKVFECLTRFDLDTQRQNLDFRLQSPEGKLAIDVWPALKFFKNLASAHAITIAPRFGPEPDFRQVIPLSEGQDGQSNDPGSLWGQLGDALSMMQEYTSIPLYFPSLQEVDEALLRTILVTGALLNGQILRREVSKAQTEHDPTAREESLSTEITVASLKPWSVRVPEGEIILGHLVYTFVGTLAESGVSGPNDQLFDLWDIKDNEVLVRKPTEEEKLQLDDTA